MSLALREYQQPHFVRLLQSLLANGYAHDGSETGTGKMFVGAGLLKAFDEEALVLAPFSVIPAWEETLNGFGFTNYTVMNYELAWRRLGAVKPWGAGSFFNFHRKYPTIVFDESHRCGGDTTINSKMMISAKRSGARLLSTSATIADTPLRMKAFGFAMGLHDLRDYTEFLLKCQCKPGTFGGWTFSGAKHPMILQGLQDQIYGQGKGSRMRKAEILGFPKMTAEVRLLGNPDKQLLRMSEEMRGYYNSRSVAAHVMEQKAEQKRRAAEAAGEECGPTGEDLARMIFIRQALEVAKVPMIADMIEDALEDSKVLVFCNYNQTIEELRAVAAKRRWSYGLIRGKQKHDDTPEREATKKQFQANQLDCLFCNIQAGGVGLSCHDPVTQVPRTSFICPTFSAIDLKQVLGRTNRDGGGFARNFLLYFEDSFEGVVARIVRGKLANLDMLNDAELTGEFLHVA